MNAVTITREPSKHEGTFGRLFVDGPNCVFECHTLELPWKNNLRCKSCIPLGSYPVEWSHSGRFGKVYRILDVPQRSGILIHPGNWAGDRAMGLRCNVEGCILLGMNRGFPRGQEGILDSREAVRRFAEFMDYQPFRLEIRG